MNIGEGSFYNTMKSKKHAYLESLKRYNATVNRRRCEAFAAAPTAALGVRALFAATLDCLDDPEVPSRVCLMAGTLTNEVLEDADLRGYVEAEVARLSQVMTARLKADQDAGILSASRDPHLMVSVIVTYMQGLFRMAAVSYDRPSFERQIDLFRTGLGL